MSCPNASPTFYLTSKDQLNSTSLILHFNVWNGSEEQLLNFMKKINSIHPTIKFTCSYNLVERSTNFLDLKITITDEGIITDLYRKETDRVQYLLPTSCHPSHIFNNVPYSLALRLVRICSRGEDLTKRFKELGE